MEKVKGLILALLGSLLVHEFAGASPQDCRELDKRKLTCHFDHTPWFSLDKIDPHLCTHLVYSDFQLTGDGLLLSQNVQIDPSSDDPLELRKLSAMKGLNPGLKTLISIDEADDESSFIEVSGSKELKEKFISAALKLVEAHKLDGLHLNLAIVNVPVDEERQASFKRNLSELVRDLRRGLDKHSPCLLLYAEMSSDNLAAVYDMAELGKHLDLVNLYDEHLTWVKNMTRIPNPMLPRRLPSGQPDPKDQANADWLIDQFTRAGAAKERLTLVFPIMAMRYNLTDSQVNGPGAPAEHTDNMAFGEFCSWMRENRLMASQGNPLEGRYAFEGHDWFGWDDWDTVIAKAKFLRDVKRVAGVTIRNIKQDDHSGLCTSPAERYPLTKALKRILFA